MFTQKKNILLLLLLNAFFFEYVLVFWGFNHLAIILEEFLLFMTPVCAFIFRREEWELRWQLLFINLLFLALWLAGIISSYTFKQWNELILCGGLCLLGGAIGLFRRFDLYRIKNHIGLLALCAFFVILSLETIAEVPAYDNGAYYAMGINKQAVNFDFSIVSIAEKGRLCNHLAMGYGLFTLLGEFLSPHRIVGVHLVNILLAIFSIVAFYGLLKYLFPAKSNANITLATAVYALSPYLLGMIGTVSTDVPSIYFFIILLWCYVKGYWLLELFFSWVFICSKEPNVVYYGFFLIGILIYEMSVRNRSTKKVQNIFVELLSRAALLFWWVLCFCKSSQTSWVTLDQEQVVHKVGFTVQNLVIKLQQIFLMNFNWIFTLAIAGGGLVYLFVSKSHLSSKKIIIPLVTSLIGIMIFNLFYIDHSHPRYITIGAEIVLILGVIVLMELISGKMISICMIVLTALLAVQSYMSVDPVTTRMFIRISPSKDILSNLVNSGWAYFDDGNIYNREYSYYYKALSKALAEADYDDSSAVVFTNFENIPKAYGYAGILFWNMKSEKLQVGRTDNSIPLIIANSPEEMKQYEKIIHIVPFWMAEDSDILQNMDVKEMYETSYRTIPVKCYVGYSGNEE